MPTVVKFAVVALLLFGMWCICWGMDRYDARKAREWAEGDET